MSSQSTCAMKVASRGDAYLNQTAQDWMNKVKKGQAELEDLKDQRRGTPSIRCLSDDC